MARAQLGVLTPVGGGDPVPLYTDRLTVGRRESADLCLSYANVSGLHCQFSLLAGGVWTVTDLKSSNGVKVNGERIGVNTPKRLRPGDLVSIAKHEFILDYPPPADLDDQFADEIEDMFQVSLLEKAGLQRRKGD